jgi:hypothetical protein
MIIGVINTADTISCVGKPLRRMPAAQFASACEQLLNPILAHQFPAMSPRSRLGERDTRRPARGTRRRVTLGYRGARR